MLIEILLCSPLFTAKNTSFACSKFPILYSFPKVNNFQTGEIAKHNGLRPIPFALKTLQTVFVFFGGKYQHSNFLFLICCSRIFLFLQSALNFSRSFGFALKRKFFCTIHISDFRDATYYFCFSKNLFTSRLSLLLSSLSCLSTTSGLPISYVSTSSSAQFLH